jgi:hypothetical protein
MCRPPSPSSRDDSASESPSIRLSAFLGRAHPLSLSLLLLLLLLLLFMLQPRLSSSSSLLIDITANAITVLKVSLLTRAVPLRGDNFLGLQGKAPVLLARFSPLAPPPRRPIAPSFVRGSPRPGSRMHSERYSIGNGRTCLTVKRWPAIG